MSWSYLESCRQRFAFRTKGCNHERRQSQILRQGEENWCQEDEEEIEEEDSRMKSFESDRSIAQHRRFGPSYSPTSPNPHQCSVTSSPRRTGSDATRRQQNSLEQYRTHDRSVNAAERDHRNVVRDYRRLERRQTEWRGLERLRETSRVTWTQGSLLELNYFDQSILISIPNRSNNPRLV